nr:MAG TPA_asm: hypothetical protein [Caudoviricetes sp.]
MAGKLPARGLFSLQGQIQGLVEKGGAKAG